MRKVSYGRIVYVEPNDIVASAGESVSLDNISWNPEELNMAVDLQVIVPRRSDFGSSTLDNGVKNTIEIWHEGLDDVGRYISFMQGADIKDSQGNLVGHELTTDYINASYTEVTSQGQSCKEALGIDSIDITFDQHFYPQVNIKFIDIRGYSLMMPTEELYRLEHIDAGSSRLSSGGYINFFRALFHFPYPRFLLTIKGFYGRSITFQLAVNEFRNNFNSETGNFEITISFIGYMYGLYTDIPLNLLIAAPYYNDSVENKKSTLWKGFNFRYDNGKGESLDGEGIDTFIEFLDKCNNLNDAIAKQKGNSPRYVNIGKVQQNSVKITALNDIKVKLRNFVREIKEKNGKAFEGRCISTADGYDVIWFKASKEVDTDTAGNDNILSSMATEITSIIENSLGEGVKIPFKEWNDFATAWNNYIKEDKLETPQWKPYGFTNGNFYYNNIDENNIQYSLKFNNEYRGQEYYNPFYNRVESGDNIIRGYENHTSQGDITIGYLAKNYKDLQNEILKSEFSKNPVYYVMGSTILKVINKRINELEEEQKELEPIAKEELEKVYRDNLGFNPTVLNIYRMLFAHLDCFMTLFYNMIDEIKLKSTERKLENFGIPKEDMDMSPYMSGSAIVPPFPAIYKEVNGRREQKYPDKELWSKMPEVIFIEKLINGIFGSKSEARRIISEQKERDNYNHENEMEYTKSSYNYTPTSISDFTHLENPYSTVPYGDVNQLMEAIVDRIISAYVQQYRSLENIGNIGEIEAQNFINLHPETPGEKFKQDLASLKEGLETGESVKKFVDYWNKQNKDYTIKYSDGKLNLNKQKLPVVSEAYPSRSSNTVFLDDNNLIPLIDNKTFLVIPKTMKEFTDFGDFVEAATKKNTPSWADFENRLEKKAIPISIDDYNEVPDILNYPGIINIDGETISNRNGDFFFNSFQKIENEEDRAGYFLMVLNSEIFHYKKGVTNNNAFQIDVYIPNPTRSSITVFKYAAVCLLGYALYKDYKTNYIAGDDNNYYIRFVFPGSGYNTEEKAGEIYNLIYNNKYLKEKIEGVFKSFLKKEWKKINPLLRNQNNYDESKDKTFLMDGEKLKQPIYDYMISPETDIAIYVLNNEIEDTVNEITINVEQFNGAVRRLEMTYGLTPTEYERTDPHFSKEDITEAYRLALYNSLKNLYDKWINSYSLKNFKLRSPEDDKEKKAQRYTKESEPNDDWCEFDNFLFVDCFYNDISNIFRMNPGTVSEIINKQIQAESNYSIYECMSEIMQKNKMLLQALPVYSNFYDINAIDEIFTPKLKDETMKSGFGSTYVGMYTYEVSHVVEDERFDDHLDSDYFMIADLNGITDDPTPNAIGASVFALPDENGGGLSIPVPAFGVTYARQNQSYFKRIDVNMDNPRVTDYSIFNMFALTNSINGNELNRPLTVANDIYSIYANRSYNCSVEMMGCANIMPMMYFQLNNIPMFRGAYMISNVEHHISAGDFTTKFSGVRISKNQLPYNADIFDCNNSFDFNTVGGGVYGLTEPPVSYNESYNNTNYRIPRDCDWDPRGAIRMMYYSRNYLNGSDRGSIDTLFTNKGGTAPLPNGSMKGGCAAAVKTFIKAGFAQIALDSSRSKEERDKAREKAKNAPGLFVNGWDLHKDNAVVEMNNYGFKRVHQTQATTKEGMNKELKEFGLKDGDILTTLMGDRTNWGHVHMWNSDIQKWVSDGPSQDAYVYNEKGGYHKKKKINYGPMKPDCGWLFRYVGCDTSKIEVAAANINTSNNNGYPKGQTFPLNGGDEPHYPYRIFNISRNATAAKNLSQSLSKITSYNSLTADEKIGKKGEANRISTTHQDAQGACNLFIYYVKKRFIEKSDIGCCSIEKYITIYKGKPDDESVEEEHIRKQYISDVALYLSKRLGREFTPQSKLEWNEPFICALGEIQARIEQGIKVVAYMHAAWNNVHNIS